MVEARQGGAMLRVNRQFSWAIVRDVLDFPPEKLRNWRGLFIDGEALPNGSRGASFPELLAITIAQYLADTIGIGPRGISRFYGALLQIVSAVSLPDLLQSSLVIDVHKGTCWLAGASGEPAGGILEIRLVLAEPIQRLMRRLSETRVEQFVLPLD